MGREGVGLRDETGRGGGKGLANAQGRTVRAGGPIEAVPTGILFQRTTV